MWQSQIETPARLLASAFADFLESDEYLALAPDSAARRSNIDHTPTCLLDIVEMWVVEGDATLLCPTFEMFLIVVIELIAKWQADPTWPLWPESADRYVPVQHLMNPATPPSEYGWTSLRATDHPVFKKENFLLQQARNGARFRRQSALNTLLYAGLIKE
jgi:hypothetical protein